jgi:ribosomal protein L37AE/L43A
VKTLQEVRESDMGSRDTPDYFTTRATIVSIKQDNIAYPACKSENCNKKVTQVGSGWQCEKCDKTWPEPEYRWVRSQCALNGFKPIDIVISLVCKCQIIPLKRGCKPSMTLELKSLARVRMS